MVCAKKEKSWHEIKSYLVDVIFILRLRIKDDLEVKTQQMNKIEAYEDIYERMLLLEKEENR